MKTLSFERYAEKGDATLGTFHNEKGEQLAVGLEHLWVDKNKDGVGDRSVSRIPAGSYRAFRILSPHRGYEVFQLEGVPGRSNIQIHRGNTVKDTEGCILLGKHEGEIDGETAVLESAAAFHDFMLANPEDEFVLTVKDIPVGNNG